MSLRYIKGGDYGRPIEEYVKGSKYFKYYELIGSESAVQRNIVNNATDDIWKSLEKLTVECLDKIREKFGPIKINSCYRNPALNKAIGGSPTSNHCKGIAADVEPVDPKITNLEVLLWCHDNIKYWELIAEKFGKNPRDGWVHIAYTGQYRPVGLKMLKTTPGSKVVAATIDQIKQEFQFA